MAKARAFTRLLLATSLSMFAGATALRAWHHQGHSDVGAIADRLLTQDHHAHALERVHAILGSVTLAQAGPWADCVRKVQGPETHFNYNSTDVRDDGTRTECYIFSHTPALLAQMRAYAERNWANTTDCPNDVRKNGCHLKFHFADVAIDRYGYAPGEVGTEKYDIVHGIKAAIAVLRSQECNRPHPGSGEAPGLPPFHFSCADALMMLVHLVGDIHQPLHVGSVYLDATGQRVDPDSSQAARALADSGAAHTTQTRGGNSLVWGPTGSSDLHSLWDETGPYGYSANYTDAELHGVRMTGLPIDTWAETWATESVQLARDRVFPRLQFGNWAAARRATDTQPRWAGGWPINWQPGQLTAYQHDMVRVQHDQIVHAGVRLTQLLLQIWPD
jgi:hypothetical protein